MKLYFILLMAVFMTVSIFATHAGYFMPTDTIRDVSDYLANDDNNDEQGQSVLREFDPDDIPYLIITTNYLRDQFIPLKDWKTRKGVKTQIITKEDISANATLNGGETVPYMQIKNCIFYYFTEFHTEYVLLGGDNDAIPQVACWGKYDTNSGDNFCLVEGAGCSDSYDPITHTCDNPLHHNAQAIPADIFYSCLDADNLNWNSNNNSKIGETNDGHNGGHIDLTPDVYVGRIPIATISTELEWLTNWINKVIDYEQSPTVSDYTQKLLLCGGKYEYWHGNGDSYSPEPHSDAAHWSNDLFNQFISPYWTAVQKDYLFDCDHTNLTGFIDPPYHKGRYRMGNTLERNYNLIFETSHASAAAWQIVNKPGWVELFFSHDVDDMASNVELGVIYSKGCTSAAWDINVGSNYSPNHRVGIAKEFLVKPTGGGAVGYIGNTRYGVGSLPDDSYIGYDYAGHFFAELLNHDSADAEYPPKLGRALAKAKANLKNHANGLGFHRWCQFSLNLVGDPELNVYTNNPTLYTNVAGFIAPSSFVLDQTNTFTLNTGDIRSKACLYDNNDVFLVQEADPSTGVISFSFTPASLNPIMLTITGDNRVPFLATIPVCARTISGTVFLQDSQEHVCDIIVELIGPYDPYYDEDPYAYQTTHPDASGAYQFVVPNGPHRVRYRLFDLESGLTYYPYTSPVMTMGPDTPDFHIIVPEYTLQHMAIGQLMVSNIEDANVFSKLSEAIKHAKIIIASPLYSQNNVYISMTEGAYFWPWTSPLHGGFTVSSNDPNTVKSITIRGVGSDLTSISQPHIEEFDIQVSNIALKFNNIHFNQGASEQSNCTYTMRTTDNGSIKFYNCCFGFREYENQTQYRTHKFVDSSNLEFDNCKFIACQANRGDFGILKFDNCDNVSITNTQFRYCIAQWGGAIHISSCEGVSISNCIFDRNHSQDNNHGSISNGTEGGAIYVYESQDLDIEGNRFMQNTACGGGGPLYINSCSMFSIVGNTFIDNYNDHLGLDTEGSHSVGFDYCVFNDNKAFARNIIKACQTLESHFLLIGRGCTGNLLIQNCVFDIGNAIVGDYNRILFSYSILNASLVNCVFNTGDQPASFYSADGPDESEYSHISISHSLFSGDYAGIVEVSHVSCNVIDMGLDASYMPIWNTTMKSPCIDNGNPDTNGDGETWMTDQADRDSDGTQMDIGAIPLIDGHIHRFHRLTSDKIRYISIPGVVNNTESGEQNSLLYVFDEFRSNGLFTLPPVLHQIRWMYNNEGDYATPTDIPEHYVHSQNGYKVTLTDNAPDMLIQYQGYYPGNPMNQGMFIQDLGRYTLDHYIMPPDANSQVDSNTGIPYREMYLGYYLQESLNPFDALLPILDNITAIMAEDWAMCRLPIFEYNPEPGDEPSDAYTDTWLGCSSTGGIAINPGEMVVVRYIGSDPIEFKLGGDNPNPPFTDPYYRDMATHFEYEEQPEYIPIFLSIDLNQFEDGDKPLEVAVFIDEECKGAAVIKEGEVQLNAYITNVEDPTEELKNLEFRMFFPGKAANAHVLDYSVLNKQSGRFESRKISVSECKEFLQIRLGKTEEPPLPSVTKLFGNYPNPFNPETTISFDLAEQCPVTIEVFNIKGQKVRTLVRDSYAPGHHSVVWNGTDSNGKPVSSGVYFYRMITPTNTLIHKMLLMK